MKLIALLFALTLHAEPLEINWWHAMSGEREKILNELVENYNKSQSQYKVVPSNKGTYTEALNAAIAAYRAKKQPHLIQVVEVGTQTMMQSKAIYPVYKLFEDTGYKIDWKSFIQPVVSFFASDDGKIISMPFNSSTPILYYNKDLFEKAKIKEPPKTWEEMGEVTKKLIASGAACGYTTSWQSWVLLENFSAIHNIPFATQGNGYKSLNTELLIENPNVEKLLNMVSEWSKDKRFCYEGRNGDPARNAFIAGKAAMLTESSAGYVSVENLAKFKWGAAPMPILAGTKNPLNSTIGGATLWVFQGFKPEEYKGIAHFLNYLAQKEQQAWFHKKTGYLPISIPAYEAIKKEGYYKQVPVQEIGIKQLTRGKVTENSRGFRLGNFAQIRDVIDEEFEKMWAGKASVKETLASITKRSNEILKNYAKTVN